MAIFWAMKEFGENHGVVYVDGVDDVLWTAAELIESEMVGECGSKARGLFARMGEMMVGGRVMKIAYVYTIEWDAVVKWTY